MARYFIYEGNIEKLDQKLIRIKNKCAKYNVEFKYEKLGTIVKEVQDEDGQMIKARFLEVEVEGFLKHDNWEFIGTIDHMKQGNIIRQYNTQIEVPEGYRYTDAMCEHCWSRRNRKFTYLVHNTETNEWKQVGHTCLEEFTGGLDAEGVAQFEQYFHTLESAGSCFHGIHFEPQFSLKDILCYAKETVDRFGYVSLSDAEFYGKEATRFTAWNFYDAIERGNIYMEKTRRHAESIGFDAMKQENQEYVDAAIAWIRSETSTDGYMFNLRLACSEDYFPFRNLGLIISLMPTYYRHLKDLEYQEKIRKAQESDQGSKYQGEVGKKLTVEIVEASCVSSYPTMYGMSYLYKFIDKDGNVYMWSTGKALDGDYNTLTGTVKSHEEFRGVKQTHLTRCKVA